MFPCSSILWHLFPSYIANAVVRAYVDHGKERHKDTSSDVLASLEADKAILEQKLSAKEKELIAFREDHAEERDGAGA